MDIPPNSKKILLFFAVFLLALSFAEGLLSLAPRSFAQEAPVCTPHWAFSHYATIGACGGQIQEIWADGCGSSAVKNTIQCGAAQTPTIQGGPSCSCSISCYPAPAAKNITDPLLRNVFEDPAKDKGADPNKLKLPANLGWNDVNDWAQKNSSASFPQKKCSVESYNYEIAKTSDGQQAYQKLVDSPSTAPVLNDIPRSCALETSNNYQWHVKACADKEGANCTSWSQAESFSTSSAPEPKLPFDSDFEQNGHAETAEPVTLEWCKSANSGVKTYELAYQGGVVGPNLPFITPTDATSYSDAANWELFKDGVPYFWNVASCTDQEAKQCGIFSQLWSFVPKTELSAPTPQTPAGNQTVNMLDSFTWQAQNYYASYFLIRVEGNSFSKDYAVSQSDYSLGQIWNDLSFNAQYSWKIASCGGPDFTSCLDQSDWSAPNIFKTTGAAPTGLAAQPVKLGRTAIPAILTWDAKPGAASYAWEVADNASFSNPLHGTSKESTTTLNELRQDTAYFWRVKTCADANGQTCGAWANSQFTTVKLSAPAIASPNKDKPAFIPTFQAKWNPVFSGNFYAYQLQYLSATPDETAACKSLAGKTIAQSSPIASESFAALDARCKGQYQLQVAACIDSTCLNTGPAGAQTFTLQELPIGSGGLVPCTRAVDNPSTPWDERESCQIKHVFLLIKTLIDFVLWRLAPILALLYGALTGAILYFSFVPAIFENVMPISKIKSIWKAFGIGVLVVFFAWLFLNLLLGILGFNVTLFGKWYEIHV